MSTEQRQLYKTIFPAPEVDPGVPARLVSDPLFTRALIIESAEGNTGRIRVAFSQTDMLSGRWHTLYEEGDAFSVDSSEFANLNAEINLNDIWFDGTVSADRLIVSYIEITGKYI
jgi:hypothetical protein